MNKQYLYIILLVSNLFFHSGCNFFGINSEDNETDILYISRCVDTIVDTTFYLWEENGSVKITSEKPYTGDTIAKPLPISGTTCCALNLYFQSMLASRSAQPL
jgi:hypothetical protein